MIRFHQTFGAHAGRAVSFEKDVITFGRLPSCDIAFDPRADLDASGEHAQVRREQGAWYVLDANSRNGTWLNGTRVTRAQLTSGDELELGRGGPRIRVEIEELVASAPPTPAFRQASPPVVAPPLDARPRASRSAPPVSRGPGLGVALMLGVVALLFAALAAGVLIWRLLTTSAADAPTGLDGPPSFSPSSSGRDPGVRS
jgi:hypothetical protein